MTNKETITQIKKLVKLMESHGENDFKIRTYQNAIQRLERVREPLFEMSKADLLELDGIGKSIATLVEEVNEKGKPTILKEFEDQTPPGILELMNFRGVGTKKLSLLWKEFNIEDKKDLRDLINSGKLLSVKGFGQKTIDSLAEIIDFAYDCEGKIYYATMEEGFYEVDVNSLEPTTLYPDANALRKASDLHQFGPLLPGAHGKGLYSGQGVMV